MIIRNCAMAALTASTSLLIATPSLAQNTSDPIAERVGPNASGQAPEFQEPVEFNAPQLPEAAPINVSGSVQIGQIAIEESGGNSGTGAIARRDWINQPLQLPLNLQAGEAMDTAWIKAQFEANNFLEKQVPLDQIATLVQTINRAFATNGFINSGLVISGAPPQDGGTLQLRLVYGSLVSGRLQNAGQSGLSVTWVDGRKSGLSESYIAARMKAAQSTPLNVQEIEEQFRLLAEDPAIRTVNADLRPGAQAGEAQLLLSIEPEDAFDLYFSAANSRSPAIGGERYSMGTSLRNGLIAGDFISVEGGLTGNLPDLTAGYQLPIFGPKTVLRARGGFNKAAVIDPELLELDITSRDWHIEGGINHTLFQRPLMPKENGWQAARSLTLGMTLAHRQSTTELLGERFSFSPGADNGRTKYTAMRISGDLVQRGINEVFALSLIATQGLDGTKSDVLGLISPDENFRSMRGQFNYARRLSDGGLQIQARLTGQYSDGILYSGERFLAGGAETVRGYRETLILADTGLVGSVELTQAFSLSPKKGNGSDFDLGAFTASTFVDGAFIGNRAGSPPASDHLASVGASLAWTPSPAISAQLTYAYAIKEIRIPGNQDLQDRGFHFRVTIHPLKLLGL